MRLAWAQAPGSLGRRAVDLDDLQSALAVLDEPYRRLLFVGLLDGETSRQFLARISPLVSSAAAVRAARTRPSTVGRPAFVTEPVAESVAEYVAAPRTAPEPMAAVSIALSRAGLEVISAEGLDDLPPEFRQGMRRRAHLIGDSGPSAPAYWVGPYAPGAAPVHVLVMVEGATTRAVEAATARVRAVIAETDVSEVAPVQDGGPRAEPFADRDHLGHERAVDRSPFGPQRHWPPEASDLSESLGPSDRAPSVDDVLLGPEPGGPTGWSHDGSFLVYRRIRQDVRAYRQHLLVTTPAGDVMTDSSVHRAAAARSGFEARVLRLRAGVSYGPEFDPAEPSTPRYAAVHYARDRGWLDLSFQASIGRGFEATRLTDDGAIAPVERWLRTTGGAYYFLPSLSGLHALAAHHLRRH